MFNKVIFKKSLNKFVNDGLLICQNNSDKIKSYERNWPIFFANKKYKKTKIENVSDYNFFINKTLDKLLCQLPSYQILIKFFVTSEFKNYNKKLNSNYHDKSDPQFNFAKNLPLKFLANYLEEHKNFEFNKKVFDFIFNSFYLFLENILNDEYVAPLFNFESDLTLKEITVGDVGIRKINAFEFFVFTHLDQNYQLSNKFYNLSHVMSLKHSSADLNSGYDFVKLKFESLIDSLSLLETGNPQFGTIHRNVNNIWIHHDSRHEMDVNEQKSMFFQKKQLPRLLKISKLLENIDFSKKENNFIEISKRRFTSALSRSSNVDQLIDLMISLESLYAPNPGEISVRLANRSSTLLAVNDDVREDYWLFIKKVYNIRSGIVHGDGIRNTEINGKKYSLDDIILKLVDLARESLLIYLKLANQYSGNNKVEKICDEIDMALINKNKLKKLKKQLLGN